MPYLPAPYLQVQGFYHGAWLNTTVYLHCGNTVHHSPMPQVSPWFLHTGHLRYYPFSIKESPCCIAASYCLLSSSQGLQRRWGQRQVGVHQLKNNHRGCQQKKQHPPPCIEGKGQGGCSCLLCSPFASYHHHSWHCHPAILVVMDVSWAFFFVCFASSLCPPHPSPWCLVVLLFHCHCRALAILKLHLFPPCEQLLVSAVGGAVVLWWLSLW